MAPTILIVEDHDQVRRYLRDWLEMEFPRHRVIEAASGEEAISLAPIESPHLVLIDIGLPWMSGIEAVRRIKTALPSAHVVMLTLHEDDVYRVCAKEAGASGFVPKWLLETELIPTMAKLLADGQEEKEVSGSFRIVGAKRP